MGVVQSFSSRAIDQTNRMFAWRNFWKNVDNGVQLDGPGSDADQSEVQVGKVGSARLSHLNWDGRRRTQRTPELIRHGNRELIVVFQLSGTSSYHQDGQLLTLSPGEWSLCDSSRPYTVTSATHVERLTLGVPLEVLARDKTDIGMYCGRRFWFVDGVSNLAYRVLRATFDELPVLSQHSANQLLDSAFELLRMAMHEHSEAPAASSATVRAHERILACVDYHLRDPRLSVEMIAAMLSCTKRYVHKVFAEQATTIGAYILQTRLEHCRLTLLETSARDQSITEIAYSWGFSSIAHFSRAFRARYGKSPSAYRTPMPT